MDLITIIVISALVFCLAYFGLFVTVRRRTVGEVQQVLARLSSRNVLNVSLRAQLLAFDSEDLGAARARGTRGQGALVLTDKEIYFDAPARRQWVLPLSTVTEAKLLTSSDGRLKKRPLLRVAYTEPDGRPEAVTWQVPNAEEWVSKLEELIGGQADGKE